MISTDQLTAWQCGECAELFRKICMRGGDTVIDFGCGVGNYPYIPPGFNSQDYTVYVLLRPLDFHGDAAIIYGNCHGQSRSKDGFTEWSIAWCEC